MGKVGDLLILLDICDFTLVINWGECTIKTGILVSFNVRLFKFLFQPLQFTCV